MGLLAPLTDVELQRQGTFAEKPVRLSDVIGMILEHDREHRLEMEAVLDQVED